jgi:hypothetical protein
MGMTKEQGAEKAYPELTNKAGKFIDRDVYVVVYQLDGKVLAHGSNEKFVGKDMSEAQDVDGKLRQGAHRTREQATVVLAGLQVRQSGEQESRTEADVLREARQYGGVRGHLQVLTRNTALRDARCIEG